MTLTSSDEAIAGPWLSRDALGWGLTGEGAILSYWQDFQNGYMFVADNNRVYVVIPDPGNPNQGQYYGPFNK